MIARRRIGAFVYAGAVLAMTGSCHHRPIAGPSASIRAMSSDAPIAGYRLAWQDEFAGNGLDAARWTARSGARRTAVNTPTAVSVAGGVLTITTYTEGATHYTGFIDTAGKYEPTYGYVEARIRFDPSPGEWGALWLQSPTMGNPIGDVAAAGAEIDIAEHRARDRAGTNIGNSYVMNVHWDGYGASHRTAGATSRPPMNGVRLAGNWHTYALLWTADGYVFYLDGIEQWRSAEGVSGRAEFVRLTCEVLDHGWAGDIPAAGYLTRSDSSTRMVVDWVRVWQPVGSASPASRP